MLKLYILLHFFRIFLSNYKPLCNALVSENVFESNYLL